MSTPKTPRDVAMEIQEICDCMIPVDDCAGIIEKYMEAKINLLAEVIRVKDESLRDLLNHGTAYPHPVTGEPIPHQANPTAAQEALNLKATQ